jgi:hypothetical protein
MPARAQPAPSIDDLLAIEPMDQPTEPAPIEQPVEAAEVAEPVEPVEAEIAPIDIAEIPPVPIGEEPIPVADEALPPQIEPPPTQVPAAELVPFEPAPETAVPVPAFPIEAPPAPVAEADDELGLPEFEPADAPATEPAQQYVPPLPPPEPIAAETPFDFIEEDEPQLDLASAATPPVLPAIPLPSAPSLELPAAAAELPMDLAPAAQSEPALELTTQPAGQAAADLEINDSLLPFLEVPVADETPIPPLPPLEEPVVPLFTPKDLEAPTVQSVVPPPRPMPAAPKTVSPPERRAAAPPPVAAQPVPPGQEEIVEPTEPTPESALQSSADQIDAASPPELPAAPGPKSADDLTDTTFGREVREFVGNEIGEIVEPPPAPVEPTPFMPEPVATSKVAPPRIPPATPPAGEVAAKAPRFEVPELKFPEGERSPLVAPPAAEAPKAQPVSEMLKVRPPPPSRAPLTPPVGAMGLASAPPAAAKPAPGQIAWGANQDNFLGGIPLDLRNKPTVAPAAPTSRSPLSNTPIGEQAVKDLIKQIDNTAAAAEAAATKPPAQSDPASPLFAVMPPRPRRGPPGAQGRGAVQNPFGGGLIDVAQGSRAGGIGDTTINTGFDGLAISPLRDMDVFSQSSATDSDEFDPDEVLNEEPSLTPRSGPGITQRPTRGGPVPPAQPSQRAERATPRRIPPPPVAPAPAPANRVQAIPETLSSLAEDIPPLDIAPPPIPPAALPPQADAPMAAEPIGSPILDASVAEALPDAPEVIDGMIIDEHQPAPTVPYAVEPQETLSSPGSIRAKYVRRVSVLVTAMVVLIALGAWAIYNYVGVSSTVEGSFTFTNLAAMNKRARTGFQENQLRSLMDSQTRQNAKRTMRPEFNPGFLADQAAYVTLLESAASFTDAKPEVLTIRISGSNAHEDRERMSAILSALYEANQFQVNDALRARRRLEENNRNIENGQKELARISTEIDKLRVAAEAQPTSEQIKKLETDVAAMEKSWTEAVKAAKDAQASLEQAKDAPVANAAVADDDQIKSMQAQVAALQTKLNAAKSATSGQAVAARKALDTALDAFQKQVTDAQSAMAGNPEAAAYIQTAQKTFENTRQVTEDLMRRQEQQFGSLMELKERWNEQMAQRRAQLWASDTRLQELTQKLSLLNRQYNAAVGSGLTKDAQEKKAEIDATQAQIKARQEQLPGDNVYADAIGQLETIIDNTKKNIAEDRRKTEQLLTTLQQGFASSESVRKLPQDQQQVAQKMQQQMAQINEARRQYNQAIDAGAADSDTQTKAQIATLQASIEARRIQLAQQQLNQGGRNGARQNQAAINAKQAQLDKLTEAETTARNAYFTKHKDLRDAQAQVADGARNAEALDALIRQKDIEQRTLQTAIADTENRQREVNEAVEPMKPEPNRDIAVTTGDDHRLLYVLISSGAILAVFFLMILWTLHTAALEEPAGSYEGFEMPPVPVSGPLNNNHKLPHAGIEHHKDDDTDEDHEPAII